MPLTGTNVDFILEGVNRFLMELAKEQIRLAFEQAEKEVADLHQRTKEGIETARLNGKQIGHPEGVRITTKKTSRLKQTFKGIPATSVVHYLIKTLYDCWAFLVIHTTSTNARLPSKIQKLNRWKVL